LRDKEITDIDFLPVVVIFCEGFTVAGTDTDTDTGIGVIKILSSRFSGLPDVNAVC
jgi:hypothetical protein